MLFWLQYRKARTAQRCSFEARKKTIAVFEQADDYKQKFLAEINDSFKNGICKILQLARDLQAIDSNHMENDSWKIRKSILDAEKTLSQSEMSAMGQLEKLDDKCENLICEKKRLETEEESARRTAREQQTVRDVGIGIMFIPIVGLIAGSIMVGVGHTAMANADDAARVAQENVNSWKSAAAKHEANISDYKMKIHLQKNDIDLISERLQEISCELKSLTQVRLEMGEVQKKLKDATFHLSTLAGKIQATEIQTRIVIFFEPIINILHDITQYLCNQKNLELFQSHVEPMIKELKEENIRLKAICDSVSESIDFY